MTTLKRILDARGLHPLKRLSQSFLYDRNYIRKVVSILEIEPRDTVIEIGAGLGMMTAEIAAKVHRLIAIEIDPRLTEILMERLAGYRNAEVICSDVLDYDFSAAEPGGQIKVIGNIPYNISSQILIRLIHFRRSISLMVLMFQKELADRICAEPGSREYGIPSVLVNMYTECSQAMLIPPQCFYPEPKVISSVLKMIIREPVQIDLKSHDFFMMTVRLAFSKRRKTLLNNLKSLLNQGYSEKGIHSALLASGIDGNRRAETLSSAELGKLSNELYQYGKAVEKT